jgi:hypothetical protein
MAQTTLTAVPVSMYAGDTLNLLIAIDNFPAGEGWTLTYGFRKESGSIISFASTASGSQYVLTVAATTSAQWIPGKYVGTARISLGSQSYTVWRGTMEVLPDLAQQADNFETRTSSKKCLDAIIAVMEGKATRDVLQTTIAGQSIGRMAWSELLSARSYFQDLVDGEQAAENAANGLGSGRNVLIRFGRP